LAKTHPTARYQLGELDDNVGSPNRRRVDGKTDSSVDRWTIENFLIGSLSARRAKTTKSDKLGFCLVLRQLPGKLWVIQNITATISDCVVFTIEPKQLEP
jgi:hypothetical protein